MLKANQSLLPNICSPSTVRPVENLQENETEGENTQYGDTTTIVDSKGNERVAKVIDWK